MTRSASLAVLLAVALAGCSGDDGNSNAATGKHFTEDRKKALDGAGKVADTLRDAANARKQAAGD